MILQRKNVLVALVMAMSLMIVQTNAQLETNVTDLVDRISFTVLNQFISESQSTIEMTTAEDLKSTIEMTTAEDLKSTIDSSTSDFSSSSLSPYSEGFEIHETFDFTSLEFSSDSTAYSPTDQTTVSTDKCDELMTLTSKLHKTRVKVANFSHMIEEQQKIIAKLTETVHDLENDVTKLKSTTQSEITEWKLKNENCRKDFNLLVGQLKVARKLYGLQKYSKLLKMKLNEFGVLNNISNSKTSIKFSVFEIESDEFSGKILSNHQLYALPPNIGSFISNLSELSASNVGLVAVDQSSFEGMNQLKVLNLSHNLITEVESEIFGSLTELKRLDLSFNNIEVIGVGAFNGMVDLEEINLQYNLLVKLPSDTFDSLLNLKILVLSFNKLKELSENIFTEINVIDEIFIDNNELQAIHPSIISDFERAKIIDLRKNFCVDQRFPEKLTMVQLVIEVSEKCRILC